MFKFLKSKNKLFSYHIKLTVTSTWRRSRPVISRSINCRANHSWKGV